MSRHIPNLLTSARFFMAIGFFVLLAFYDADEPPAWPLLDVAVAVFLVAVLTDVVDGRLARKWGVVTNFGRIADPFCDKIIVMGALIYFIGTQFVRGGDNISGWEPWMVVVILGREFLVTGMRGLSESQKKAFAATWAGKLKMFLQSVAIVWTLVWVGHYAADPSPPAWLEIGLHISIWAVTLFTAFSALIYVKRAAELIRMSEG